MPLRVIGIDAGATKTAAVAETLEGRGMDRIRTGPSAIVGMPDARALAVLRDIVDQLAPQREDLAHVAIGLSGVDFPEEHPEQHRRVAEAIGVPRDRLLLVNDSLVALAGAATTDRATLVQHGTEVTMAWRARVGEESVFDSVGIADCFDLRLKTVPLVARMLDGRTPATPLKDQVLAHCGVDAKAFARWVIRDPGAKDQILKIGPVVFAAWRDGDTAAVQLVDAAVDDYVTATVAMADRLGPGAFQACFGGGTIDQGGAALLATIGERLSRRRSDATLASPARSPEDGALILARRAATLATVR